MDDDILMTLYRNGDMEAFEMLFERHRTSVYNFAFMMLNDAGKAEDMMQETFMTVARVAREYDCRGCFKTWIMRIVRNRCVNALNMEQTRRKVFKESGIQVIDSPSREPSPLQVAERTEQLRAVRKAIAGLPEREREAIVLYVFDRMEYHEIAAILQIPLNTVKSLIYRARSDIARSIDD